MIIEALAWMGVVTMPLIALGIVVYCLYRLYVWAFKVKMLFDDIPSPLQEMKVKEPNMPEWTSIDEQSFMEGGCADVDCNKIVDPGTRVWRIYRSIDRIHWAECDPALTERAACNYADYIKRSNPLEYVRCNDPNGVILFYE